jgi:hypothetical protein
MWRIFEEHEAMGAQKDRIPKPSFYLIYSLFNQLFSGHMCYMRILLNSIMFPKD